MAQAHTKTLVAVLQRLHASPLLQPTVAHLAEQTDAINRELGDTVLAEIPAFTETRNPDVLPDLARHGARHTEEILRLLGGGSVDELAFVRDHAERRAEQRFPLEATLHAYRCGHKVFARRMREAALATAQSPTRDEQNVLAWLADFAIEYTDAISTVAAASYVAHTRLLADVAGDQRAEMLSILLDGYDESDGRVASLLREAGHLDRRQSFCVVTARSVEPAEMLKPARARRMADALDALFRPTSVRRIVDVRNDRVVMVLCDIRRASGWTAPQTSLARRLTPILNKAGPAVQIGVSNDVPSTSRVPQAYNEALMALDMSTVSRRVVQFSDIAPRQLLLHFAGERLRAVMPAWSSQLFAADERAAGALTATLRAYGDANMNILQTAKTLNLHANTVYARLQRVRELTGLEPREFHALAELLLISDCGRRSTARRLATTSDTGATPAQHPPAARR